ncbi:MAG: serine dehydratase subunit alpha family protein [Lachnospiraceae bacterium]|nr:serine dehydratase subunit alpha family protein [Lachnospiraceae bacterium]
MERTEKKYQTYVQILKEELVPAMGCTEPIAIAYCAAKARKVLEQKPDKVVIEVSGNIIKNVKSVIVPNTGGLKGIEASAAAGIIAGKEEKILEVISEVTEDQKKQIKEYLEEAEFQVIPSSSDVVFDIVVTVYAKESYAKVRIINFHTNVVFIEKDGVTIYEAGTKTSNTVLSDRSLLNVEDIIAFADSVEISDVKEVLERQVSYNMAIAKEGMKGQYGANIGKVLSSTYGDDVKVRAKAMAAAGSDARMSGCELPVIINSGSGNQGMTASIPVVVYAEELGKTEEELYRALVVSNLITIHLKTGIGRLSAYCGAVSAGCGAGCGIAYLNGGRYDEIAHTLVNAVAIASGIVCDGAKPSCAAKIGASVDAGLMGYYMYVNGQQFRDGDGIVKKGVENTIANVSRLGQVGMRETDKEIIKIMVGQ